MKTKFNLSYFDIYSFVVESEMPRLISTVEGHNEYINAVFLPVWCTLIYIYRILTLNFTFFLYTLQVL